MEYLYLIGAIILIIAIIIFVIWGLIYLLPFLLVLFGAIYIYNRFFRRSTNESDYTEEYIDDDSNVYDSYTSSYSPRNDVIDVEYTERDDEE